MLPCFNIFVYYTAKLYVDALCYQPKSSTNTTEWATYLVNNDEEKVARKTTGRSCWVKIGQTNYESYEL